MKKIRNKKTFFAAAIFTPFMSKSFLIRDHFFPLLFPKDSEYLTILDIGLLEVGAKKPLNRVRKCDEQTDKQTNKHTNILTYKNHWPRGLML